MTHEHDRRPTLDRHDDLLSRDRAGTPGRATLTSRHVMRAPRDARGVADGADHAVERAASSTGDALPGVLREKFEASLGADLSAVRLHTGAESQQAAASVGARAYATGNDVHFAAGEYDPSSSEGQFLIAHEVAHTVQQAGGVARRQAKMAVSSAGDASEVEADRAAAAMVAGQRASVGGVGGGLHRTPTTEAKGGATLTTKSAKFAGEVSQKTPPITFKYGELTAKLTLAGSGEITFAHAADDKTEIGGPGAVSGTGAEAGFEGKYEVYKKKIEEEGFKKAQESWTDGYVVDNAVVIAGAKSTDKAGTIEDAVSAGVEITFKNGQKATIAVKVGDKGSGNVVSVSAALAIPSVLSSFDLDNGDKFIGKVDAKFELEATPNWSAIAADVGRTLASEAFFVIGNLAIVAGMTVALLKETSALADIDACAAAVKNAQQSWAAGFATGLGVARTGPDPAAYGDGLAQGQAKLAEMVGAVRGRLTEPASDDEIKAALMAESAKQTETIFQAAWKACEKPIALQAVNAYHAAHKDDWGSAANVRALAAMVGVPEWKPPAGDAPAAPPVSADQAPAAPVQPDDPGTCDPETASCEDAGPRDY